VDPASSSTRSHAALITGSAARSTTLLSAADSTEVPTAGRCHGLRLGNDLGVAVGMLCNNRLQDMGELWVFLERVWGRWDGRGDAEGDFGSWRVGGKEGEDVSAEGLLAREDVLRGSQHVA
jgi:hypothetical protein